MNETVDQRVARAVQGHSRARGKRDLAVAQHVAAAGDDDALVAGHARGRVAAARVADVPGRDPRDLAVARVLQHQCGTHNLYATNLHMRTAGQVRRRLPPLPFDDGAVRIVVRRDREIELFRRAVVEPLARCVEEGAGVADDKLCRMLGAVLRFAARIVVLLDPPVVVTFDQKRTRGRIVAGHWRGPA